VKAGGAIVTQLQLPRKGGCRTIGSNLVILEFLRGRYETSLMTDWYFVWVEGVRGPAPQKWSADALWSQAGRQDIIVRFPLTDREAKLSLDELAKVHPIPGE
jgi:hypothetical protein